MKNILYRLDPASATTEHEMSVQVVANQCARLFELIDWHVSVPFLPADVARHGDSTKAGLLLAAVELRALLCDLPYGRKALGDLGFEPVLEGVERE